MIVVIVIIISVGHTVTGLARTSADVPGCNVAFRSTLAYSLASSKQEEQGQGEGRKRTRRGTQRGAVLPYSDI